MKCMQRGVGRRWLGVSGVWVLLAAPLAAQPAALPGPRIDGEFWKHWGDGQAELCGYEYTVTRYGQPRRGSAVAIFVTERFVAGAGVKSEAGGPGTVPVMKLNLIKDFPTGLYDYNLMASVFVRLAGDGPHPAGTPLKISFSSQEWCGHVYQQLRFDKATVRQTVHSYFEGEADAHSTLDLPRNGLAEDVLLLWARGLAWPVLAPGSSTTVPILTSLQTARLQHQPLTWKPVRLARSAGSESVTVPAGIFEVEQLTAAVEGGPRWTFWVERAHPHRVVRWESDRAESGRLLASERLAYWTMNANGQEQALRRLGLTPG